MAYVSVPKDLTKVKNKVAFNLTKRQLICIGIGAATVSYTHLVDDFVVKITENHPDTPQTWRVLLDKEFKAKLKIIKKDAETQKSVLLANTEFKVYDLDNQKYVEQTTSYPVSYTHLLLM